MRFRASTKAVINWAAEPENTMIKLIAFDADDTLWENEALYQKAAATSEALLAKYGIVPRQSEIDAIEIRNLP
jgi:FMN phosphatase YigB (HAD superfamily)